MHQRGRAYHISRSKTFSHTVPKDFVGEHFGVSENFGYRKILCIRDGGSIIFLRRKLCVTQYRKISLANTSVYQKISDIETFYASERERGDYVSPPKTFCHTVPKNLVGEHFGASGDFGYRKILCIRERRGITFLRRKLFCHTVAKNFVGEYFGVSGNIGYRKILCIREGGHITFLGRKLSVTQYLKISLGNTSVYRKFWVSKIYCMRERGDYVSPPKTFCHTVPKSFVGEHFGVSESFVYRNVLCIREREREREREKERETEMVGEYHVSPSKIFCLPVPIKFVGEHFCVSKGFWYRILEAKEGEASQFCRKFFYLIGPKKIRQGINLFSREILVGKKIMNRMGDITIFPQKVSVSLYRKCLLGNTSVHREISGIERFYASEREGVPHFSVEKFCHPHYRKIS